jgi:hypothetical protein
MNEILFGLCASFPLRETSEKRSRDNEISTVANNKTVIIMLRDADDDDDDDDDDGDDNDNDNNIMKEKRKMKSLFLRVAKPLISVNFPRARLRSRLRSSTSRSRRIP